MFAFILLGVLLLSLPFLYRKIYFKRFQQYGTIPQLPPSFFWGHLAVLDQFIKRGPADRHPDSVFGAMHDQLGKPPLMFVDLRPINRPMVLVTSRDIAEQLTSPSTLFPTSVPKSKLEHINHIIGDASILAAPEKPWKALRKRFSPGFAPQHLLTLLPQVLDKTDHFIQHLDRLAESGEQVAMLPLLINLTFDIIGAITMDFDLKAQDMKDRGELIRQFEDLLYTYRDDKADLPWWIIPHVHFLRYRLGRSIDMRLRQIVQDKYVQYQQSDGNLAGKSRSVLALSFQGSNKLTPDLLKTTCDQMKTFLFAGHDTTSTLLSWVFYELSRTPRVAAAARKELDDVLGSDSSMEGVRSRLLAPHGSDLINRLTYVSAIIKETLRLHPAAATARTAPAGTNLVIETPDGKTHYLDNTILYNCNSIIHRDPELYGETCDIFSPERWLNSGSAPSATANLPPGAWRPFERGPRNCIGQDLANMEAKVIIAAVLRRYGFSKVGLGAVALDEKGKPILRNDTDQYKVVSEVYKTRQISTKPVDGMIMKVQRLEF